MKNSQESCNHTVLGDVLIGVSRLACTMQDHDRPFVRTTSRRYT